MPVTEEGRVFFQRIVEVSGLSPIFANHSLRRACKRVGVDPDNFQRSDLPKVIPEIEKVLLLYLSSEEVKYRLRIMLLLE